jgi:N-acetylmuramoyl-L-alanine amidase
LGASLGNDRLVLTSNLMNDKYTVIIDAGHGGEDCGAIGNDNTYEKDLNLQISLKLGEYLKNAGYEVIYTRTDDRLLYTEEQNIKGMKKIYDLKNRVDIANSYENSLMISIHMNSFGQENCSGLQVYHSGSEKSKKLASMIQDVVVKDLQKTNKRTVKAGSDLYILKNTIGTAVLIECGFISNSEECKKLSEKEYQKELCFAIVCGIIEYTRLNNP